MDLKAFATEFLNQSINGWPYILVVIGLVSWFKEFKRPDGSRLFLGNDLLLISMGIGLVFGGAFILAKTRPPVGDWWTVYVYWFGAVVYGLLLGLVASGLYNVVKGFLEKTFPGAIIDLIQKLGQTTK